LSNCYYSSAYNTVSINEAIEVTKKGVILAETFDKDKNFLTISSVYCLD